MDLINETGMALGWMVGRVPPSALTGTFILKGSFALESGAPLAPLPEPLPLTDEVFEGDDEKQSLRYPGDAALFKPRADLLLVGDAVPPGGRGGTVLQVDFSVGAWKKSVAVIGNRRWAGGIVPHPSEPEPFKRVPLRWENAYGGPGYKWNPLGRGAEGSVLPNLELPGNLITSKSAPPAPAAFAPIPRAWPQRNGGTGTFDRRWLKDDWPWLPKDFEWSNLNAAPEDQRAAFLRGDEDVRVTHMHPDHPEFSFRLPGLRPRWFILQKTAKGDEFVDLRLHLDTLWVDMKALHVALVWRAVHPVSDRKLRDVLAHYVATEPLAEKPGAPDAHRKAFEKRREASKAPPPETAPVPGDAQEPEEKALAAAAAERRTLTKRMLDQQKRLRKYLVDRGKAHGPALDLLGDDRSARFGFLAPVLAYYEGLKEKIPDLAEEVGPPPMPDEPLYQELLKPGPPWTRKKVETWAPKGHDFAEQDLSNLDLSGLELSKGKFDGAVLTAAILRKSNLAEASLKGAFLAGADLREADLSGADASAADLAGANLSKACLKGAKLEEAVLAKAVLREADLSGAKAGKADFAGADLAGAKAPKACFQEADLSRCRLDGADLTEAELVQAVLEGASGTGLKAKGAKIEGLRAAEARLPGATFRGAEGKEPVFEDAVLDEADFFGAKIPQPNFINASARKALFSLADCREARFDEADLREAKALKTDLFKACFEGARLQGADFSASNLYGAEFWLAGTKDAVFVNANLKGTKLG